VLDDVSSRNQPGRSCSGGKKPIGNGCLGGREVKIKEGPEASGLGYPVKGSLGALGGSEAMKVGGLRRPEDDSRGALESKEQDVPVSPEDLAASDLMRGFLSWISKEPDIEPQGGGADKRGSAPGRETGSLEGADRMQMSPGFAAC
jgi:hypothetical protein